MNFCCLMCAISSYASYGNSSLINCTYVWIYDVHTTTKDLFLTSLQTQVTVLQALCLVSKSKTQSPPHSSNMVARECSTPRNLSSPGDGSLCKDPPYHRSGSGPVCSRRFLLVSERSPFVSRLSLAQSRSLWGTHIGNCPHRNLLLCSCSS